MLIYYVWAGLSTFVPSSKHKGRTLPWIASYCEECSALQLEKTRFKAISMFRFLTLYGWSTLLVWFQFVLELSISSACNLQLSVLQIKAEMEEILEWLVPMAASTSKCV